MKYYRFFVQFILAASFLTGSMSVNADTGDLVSCEIICQDGIIEVEAEVFATDKETVTGTVAKHDFENADILKQLYGSEDKWEYENGDFCKIKYDTNELSEDAFVSAEAIGNVLSFEIKYFDIDQEQLLKLNQCGRTEAPEELSELLGIEAIVTNYYEMENECYYVLQELVEDVPIAWMSPVFSKYSLTYQENCLVDLFYQGNFTVQETSVVECISISEALEMLQMYADIEMIHCPPSNAPISRAQMCYYLEEINDEITFRPVWVFSVEGSVWEGDALYKYEEMIYLDAQDGLLLKYFGA